MRPTIALGALVALLWSCGQQSDPSGPAQPAAPSVRPVEPRPTPPSTPDEAVRPGAVEPPVRGETPPPAPVAGTEKSFEAVMVEMDALEQAGRFHEAYALGLESCPNFPDHPRISEFQTRLKRLKAWKTDLQTIRASMERLADPSPRVVANAQRELALCQEPATIILRQAIDSGQLEGRTLVNAIRVFELIRDPRMAGRFLIRRQQAKDPDLRKACLATVGTALSTGDPSLTKAVVEQVLADRKWSDLDLLASLLAVPCATVQKGLETAERFQALTDHLSRFLVVEPDQAAAWIAALAGPQTPEVAAGFLCEDRTTKGDWPVLYGMSGYQVAGGAMWLPPSIEIGIQSKTMHTWAATSDETRALVVDPRSTGRTAVCWTMERDQLLVDVVPRDGGAHTLAAYCLDWQPQRKGQPITVELLDPSAGNKIIDRRQVVCQDGVYLLWRIQGPVALRFGGRKSQPSALAGLFLDRNPLRQAPAVAADWRPVWATLIRLVEETRAMRLLKRGWSGEYYGEKNCRTLTKAQVDERIEVKDPPGQPAPKEIGIRWTGRFRAPLTGQYNFVLASHGNAKFNLDGQQVAEVVQPKGSGKPKEQPKPKDPKTTKNPKDPKAAPAPPPPPEPPPPLLEGLGTVDLVAGTWHTALITYAQDHGTKGLQVFWKGPGFERTPLDASAVFHLVPAKKP